MIKLPDASRRILMLPIFSTKAPKSFELGDEVWLDNVPVLTVNADGVTEIAYSSYHVRPTDKGNHRAQQALDDLDDCLIEATNHIYLPRGAWVVWNNSWLVHCRGEIGDGRRLLHRNYIRRDLDAMRRSTGTPGPIFSATTLLKSQGVIRNVA